MKELPDGSPTVRIDLIEEQWGGEDQVTEESGRGHLCKECKGTIWRSVSETTESLVKFPTDLLRRARAEMIKRRP
tara:strand:+ start:315 stop:539 length:225 start_codon:yes stop_codon:yes gene_type:complete